MVHQARRKHFLSGTATGVVAIRPREARKNFFNLHFSVVWIGSRSTFVLCTVLPRPVPSYGAVRATAPPSPEKLASEYNKILFVRSS